MELEPQGKEESTKHDAQRLLVLAYPIQHEATR